MGNITNYNTQVLINLQDNATYISHTTDVNAQIKVAVESYSKDRPLRKVHKGTGDGTYSYSMPSDWVDGFSYATSMEYPGGEQIPAMLEDDAWMIYRDDTGLKIRFKDYTPGSTETFYMCYVIPHNVDDMHDTVSSCDFYAVCCLATAYCLMVMANKVQEEQESTIGADTIDRSSKAVEYKNKAKFWMDEYERMLKRKDPEASVSVKDFDTELSTGEDYLTHPREGR